MNWFWNLNLIHFFEFYLAAILLFSTALRIRMYRAILALLRAMPGRWPRLLQLIKGEHGMFLTWRTLLPGGLALTLCLAHTLACRLVWPQARVTPAVLWTHGLALVIVFVAGIAMVVLDVYTLFRVGEIDRGALEKHFDQAEYWLRSWTAPLVRVLSFGWLNPHRIVHAEVEKALAELNRMLSSTLWWVCLQTGLRLTFGLAIWVGWAYLGASVA
jgi:hypothetical protein